MPLINCILSLHNAKHNIYHKLLLVILLSFTISPTNLVAQKYFEKYPVIKNYERAEFNAGMQNWMISQASNNLMYFANNHGLLEFDGHNWELYGLHSFSTLRAVMADNNGKIYVGLSNDFGYFETDSAGSKHFHSFLELLPDDHKNLDEIWKIHNTSDGIIYQTYSKLIVVKNNKIKIHEAPYRFYLSFSFNNKLFVVDWRNGILEFKNGKLFPLKGTNIFQHSEINSITPYGKDLMISTLGKGVFIYKNKEIKKWDTPINSFLIDNQIYCTERIDENKIAFGTILKGLVICDNNGSIISTIDKTNGLQNNTILSMLLDKSGNLWLGTNNGIDLLYLGSPISLLGIDNEYGSGYTSIIHNNTLYLGTNQGLYYKDLGQDISEDFKLIKRLKGQVWRLEVIDNTLFCGHNKGTFLVEKDKTIKVGDIAGGWIYLQHEEHPDVVIGGTYTGLVLFKKINNQWTFQHKIKGFNESSRMMYFDYDGSIWMSHGLKGVYHLTLNEAMDSVITVDFYNSKNGFPTDFGINIARIQNQIIFLSNGGAFKFNPNKKSIESSKYFNQLLDSTIYYAIEDIYGNIWHYSNDGMGVEIIKKDGSYKSVKMPFKQLQGRFIEGFQHVYPLNKSNFLISYENGFVNYSTTKKIGDNKPFNLYLSNVTLTKNDSTIYKGHLFDINLNTPNIKYKNNSLLFSYSAVHYENPYKVEFSTYLEGFDEEWSNWQDNYYKEFTNLKEGNYTFHIKARNIHNIESDTVSYQFTINPPWARTKLAYLIYSIGFLALVILIISIIQKRITHLKLKEEKLQRQKFLEREKEMQRDALIQEKEIIRLRNEKLRFKIKTKDKELANSTMQTIKTNKFLISLKKDMQKNNSEMISEVAKTQNKKLIKKIDNEINSEKNWKVFETHFGNVHEEFLTKLKKEHPKLSPAELRLCACLRMNISSKEIATLLNISLRGVEASRYRLRKSLDLTRETNLTEFILSI